jgi:hypothetical protein
MNTEAKLRELHLMLFHLSTVPGRQVTVASNPCMTLPTNSVFYNNAKNCYFTSGYIFVLRTVLANGYFVPNIRTLNFFLAFKAVLLAM